MQQRDTSCDPYPPLVRLVRNKPVNHGSNRPLPVSAAATHASHHGPLDLPAKAGSANPQVQGMRRFRAGSGGELSQARLRRHRLSHSSHADSPAWRLTDPRRTGERPTRVTTLGRVRDRHNAGRGRPSTTGPESRAPLTSGRPIPPECGQFARRRVHPNPSDDGGRLRER